MGIRIVIEDCLVQTTNFHIEIRESALEKIRRRVKTRSSTLPLEDNAPVDFGRWTASAGTAFIALKVDLVWDLIFILNGLHEKKIKTKTDKTVHLGNTNSGRDYGRHRKPQS